MTFNVLEGLVDGSLSGFSGGFPQTARKGFSFCPTDCRRGQELGDVLKGVYPYTEILGLMVQRLSSEKLNQ